MKRTFLPLILALAAHAIAADIILLINPFAAPDLAVVDDDGTRRDRQDVQRGDAGEPRDIVRILLYLTGRCDGERRGITPHAERDRFIDGCTDCFPGHVTPFPERRGPAPGDGTFLYREIISSH